MRIDDRQILEIGADLPPHKDSIFAAQDMIVAPGLIDLHAHVNDGMGLFSLNPAEVGLRTGVTTLLDTGSAGALTYGTFHDYVIPQAAEDIFALLNISQLGVQGGRGPEPFFGELSDLRYIDVSAAVACIEAHRDRIVGQSSFVG